jgi:hypothetical protein
MSILYTSDGINWITARTWDYEALYQASAVKNYDVPNTTMVDVHEVVQHYFEVKLDRPVSISGVRLNIVNATRGMFISTTMSSPPGSPNVVNQPVSPWIAEIYLFNETANQLHPVV